MRERWPSRRDALALLALGVLGNCVYQVLFIEGMARTGAGTAALFAVSVGVGLARPDGGAVVAQAWSIAELLRATVEVRAMKQMPAVA